MLFRSVAAEKLPFPGCVAVIEQTPTDTNVALDPDTVQTARVLLANATVRPEVAVAVNATGPALCAVSGGWLNVITLLFAVTLKVLVTGVAAPKLPFPGCVTVIEHTPTDTNVALDPDTVQTAKLLLANATVNPEVAVAVNATGPALCAVSGGWLNVITLLFAVTLNVLVTGVAAEKLPFPGCVAVIEQTPTDTRVALDPDTVQTARVLLANATVNPEVAVAVNATGPALCAVSGG